MLLAWRAIVLYAYWWKSYVSVKIFFALHSCFRNETGSTWTYFAFCGDIQTMFAWITSNYERLRNTNIPALSILNSSIPSWSSLLPASSSSPTYIRWVSCGADGEWDGKSEVMGHLAACRRDICSAASVSKHTLKIFCISCTFHHLWQKVLVIDSSPQSIKICIFYQFASIIHKEHQLVKTTNT